MRINAGKFKGFPILTRDIAGTRPTLDKIKQALFNVLGPQLYGKSVLDLFSGFGSLGLEALSRGARPVIFVESNPKCSKLIHENLSRFREVAGITEVLTADAFRTIEKLKREGRVFDIVLCDAPYGQGVNANLLNVLAISGILRKESLLVFQHEKREQLPEKAGPCQAIRSYLYGNSSISLYKRIL